MKFIEMARLGLLCGLLSSGSAIAANETHPFEGFKSIESIEELMELPSNELCSNGGPTSTEINIILLNGPLAASMYGNDPIAARQLISEQAKKIRANVKEKCSTSNVPLRKFTLKTIKDEKKVCEGGVPTKEELNYMIKNTPEITARLDEGIKSMPIEVQLVMQEAAKSKGTSLRELMVMDMINNGQKSWIGACGKLATHQPNAPSTINDEDTKKSASPTAQQEFDESDRKLNILWRNLDSATRKRLLPEQRNWIKYKDNTCKSDIRCLTKMTNDRIIAIQSGL